MSKLRKLPLYLLLLPVFFVEHGFMENFAFIRAKDTLLLTLSYCLLSLAVFVVIYLFGRNSKRAALITALFLCLFFFFGAVHEFLKEHAALRFLSRYSVSLTVSIFVLVLFYFFIRRKATREQAFNAYLNTLLIIFILVDIVAIGIKAVSKDTESFWVQDHFSEKAYYKCDSCKKPNIYFLLFDEYASSASLLKRFNFHNDLDSFLLREKFTVQTNSRANYDFTPFSIASILNMAYVQGIRNIHSVDAEDYARCNALIQNAEVMKFLEIQGYDIVNYSIFDLKGNPSLVNESFLPIKTNLISDRTLYSMLRKDVGWIVQMNISFLAPDPLDAYLENNNKFLTLVEQRSSKKWNKPSFIYAHLDMPHPPYSFDARGRKKDRNTVRKESLDNSPSAYLEYIQYVNGRIRQIIQTIKRNDTSAVIVLMGDHGFRKTDPSIPSMDYLFQNLNAIYTPDNRHLPLYDSITGVNQFRVIFNGLFAQQFPMLPDSLILLQDKQ